MGGRRGRPPEIQIGQRIIPIFLVLIESKGKRRISGGRPRLTPLLLSPIRHGRTTRASARNSDRKADHSNLFGPDRIQRQAANFWRTPSSYSTSPFPNPSWEDDEGVRQKF